MSRGRILLLTTLAMIAFAGNSLLCRLALSKTSIDPGSFTWIRIVSGAAMLWLIVRVRSGSAFGGGSWLSALALFIYGITFSFAYAGLTAATGALLLFGAVQATMVGHGLRSGERLSRRQTCGMALAGGGLIWLLLPGLAQPPLGGAMLMLLSGAAWGVYSLRGKGAGDPAAATAGNFARAAVFAVALGVLGAPWAAWDLAGVACAVASGALASAVGYIIWYSALPGLTASGAAVVQLTVPVLAAAGGVVLLGEAISARLAIASVAILGGVAMVIYRPQKPA